MAAAAAKAGLRVLAGLPNPTFVETTRWPELERMLRGWLDEGVAGMARLHAMIGEHLDPNVQDDELAEQVKIGIETDRGPWVQALIAAGYQVYAVNPLQAARFRERISVSGAKSDPGDCHMLADMVRTDSHQLRPVAGDSDLAEAVKVPPAKCSSVATTFTTGTWRSSGSAAALWATRWKAAISSAFSLPRRHWSAISTTPMWCRSTTRSPTPSSPTW